MNKIKKSVIFFLIILLLFPTHMLYSADNLMITFDISGGDFNSQPASIPYTANDIITSSHLAVPTKSGYTFSYWSYNDAPLPDDFMLPSEPITLTAVWKQNTVQVTFNMLLANAQNIPADFAISSGAVLDVTTLPTPTHTRYDFAGWSANNLDVTTIVVPDNGLTLTAKWSNNIETIALDVNGGSTQSGTILQQAIGTKLLLSSLPIPIMQGYDFIGWGEHGVLLTEDIFFTEENRILIAHWQLENSSTHQIKAQNPHVTIQAGLTDDPLDYEQLFGITTTGAHPTITYSKPNLTTHTIGTHYILVTSTASNGSAQMLLMLTVTDILPPEIQMDKTVFTFLLGATVPNTIQDIIPFTATDNITQSTPTILISGYPFSTNTLGIQTITLTAVDTAQNIKTQDITVEILPITISGSVFWDDNLNSLQDDAHFLELVELFLIPSGKPGIILDTIKTDSVGNYTLTTNIPPNKSYDSYQVCLSSFVNYTSAPQNNHPPQHLASQFLDDSTCSKSLNAEGSNITDIQLGLHGKTIFSAPAKKISIPRNKIYKVYIPITNGRIEDFTISQPSLGKLEKMNNGLIITTHGDIGVADITVRLRDNYGRIIDDTIEFTIDVTK